jgi:hypothetical protein
MSDRDYYEILGLTPGADGVMVDQTYWHLARKYQTLAADDPRAHQMLDELNEAYGVLGTPRLREQYDAFRDDILVQKGIVGPVRSKPRPERKPERHNDAAPAAQRPLLARLVVHWREALIGGGLLAVAGGAVSLGLGPVQILAVLAAVTAAALTPVARARLAAAQLRMPQTSMPQASMPERPQGPSAPRNRPRAAAPTKRATSDADDLAASTASMIARWRNTVGLTEAPAPPADDKAPDTTLVEIFQSEQDVDAQDEPLTAVLDILRGSRRPIESR